MTNSKKPAAVIAKEIPPRTTPSTYPEPFFSLMKGREKRALGDFFGIKNFGVNLTRISPNGQSSLFHRHLKQDEMIFVLEGTPTLITDDGEYQLGPGMCAGFVAGGTAHQLVNRSDKDVVYLEVGDRAPGDEATYPRDDVKASLGPDGKWVYTHKDGKPYPI
jgi:uncharacterized cupin superfamily protein